uniref:Uncharacterized protein n=1 Tax=Pseudanabaena tenuis (strain PCC 7409) TaxID=29415 RepID=Q52450_PSETP|nr:hypothetical protein [Pseudanabaena tenuis PCC 7409]prf//2015397E cpcB2 upstream ORF X [Pseudanabaena sp.]
MTGDLLTSERGLFDLQLELKELDQPTTYQMLINYLNSVRIKNDCKDINDPRSVIPFLPETAKKFCEVSLGKPRLFNRLGSTVLLTATGGSGRSHYSRCIRKRVESCCTKFAPSSCIECSRRESTSFITETRYLFRRNHYGRSATVRSSHL